MRFRDGVQNGSVTVTFRRWKRCQAIAGHRYRTAVGIIEVEAVDVIDAAKITNADARRSGYPSAAAVIADLRGTDDLPIYRVQFHAVHGPDPRDELANTATLTDDEVADLDRRLDPPRPRQLLTVPGRARPSTLIAEHPARASRRPRRRRSAANASPSSSTSASSRTSASPSPSTVGYRSLPEAQAYHAARTQRELTTDRRL